ncbi:DUF308 domain-containing protein [Pelagibacterium halotolerans]|uniref:Transmembrane protein n=1 Tax=Pelagibacterium halotolerans (strain DSM 22347 / JCM 15775 / CGMCC 1.7692 / B2) TaxID=1082931 RepID=G4RFE0_PELHB|nr:hypothetical protein KKY_1968 [Pelagibacterium halotolerans B2]
MTLDFPPQRWLKTYYASRAAFSLIWAASLLTIGQQIPLLGAALLVLYPAWDAAANYLDAAQSGGLKRNRTQALNLLVSIVAAVAILAALQVSSGAVLAVFGTWAILSGLLQLGTAIRRWKSSGAQWAMTLSGGQSALAGAFFILQAQQDVPALAQVVAGYAVFGAIFFLASAASLFFVKKTAKAA